jgi:hypothetical protein
LIRHSILADLLDAAGVGRERAMARERASG